MSSFANTVADSTAVQTLPVEDRRGIYAMWCVIATEASLFLCLFGAYFYLGNTKERWTIDRPPELHYAWMMLVVLLVSAFLLRWGEKQVNQARFSAGRLALLLTIVLGLGFLALQYFDYASHLKTLTPYSDSYGSLFYAISGFHVVHIVVGILLLAYTWFLPQYGPTTLSPYRPYQTVALYWYFVNALWICIFLILYLIPNLLVYG